MIQDYVALDLEMTGSSAKDDRIIEIGMVKVIGKNVADEYTTLVNPGIKIPERITEITGINNHMLEGKPLISEIIGDVLEFIGDYPILGHSIICDFSFLKKACVNNNLKFEKNGIDTLKLARKFLPELPGKSLTKICEFYGINDGKEHRALYDAHKASEVYLIFCEQFRDEMEKNMPLPLKFNAKKDTPITKSQNEYLKNLINYHKIEDIDLSSLDALTKSQASRLTDRIISSYGRMERRK